MKWEQETSILPLDCFSYHFETERSKPGPTLKLDKAHEMPALDDLQEQESFAKLWWSLSVEGIRMSIQVDKAYEKVSFPHIERGDSIELFIDTRDNKASKVVTQYCHHFAILPEAIEGKSVFEITRFHVYHTREFVDTGLCQVESEKKRKGYKLNLFFPKQMLFGYDLASFNRLGFTYKINGFNREAQYFVVWGDEYNIALHPHLWGSFLIK